MRLTMPGKLNRDAGLGSGLICALFLYFLSYGQAFGMGGFPPPTPTPSPTPGTLKITYLSSLPTGGGPIRIATDKAGVLYAAVQGSGNAVQIWNNGSMTGSINGFKRPLSVAVDSSGNLLYVGDFKDGSVSVQSLNPKGNGSPTFLGKGKGEFGLPGGIAVASNGFVYVTDSLNNVVKVYGGNGAYQFSFGGYGTGTGQMIFPTGIAADNTNQEMFVVDHNNGRIEVFDFQGNFKRTFGAYGAGPGMLTRPQGIHVASGKVYVADAYQSSVAVFSTSGNFIGFIGQFGNEPGNLRIPMDVKSNGTKVFVSNSDNRRIEVFDVLDPQGLSLNPSAISFSANAGSNPPEQSVQVDSQVSGNPVSWTATVTSPFTILLSQTSGSTASTVSVGVDVTGLQPGDYTGTVNFRANGIDYPLTVNCKVLPPPNQLFAAPGSLDFLYQKDGTLVTKALSITSNGAVLNWTAATDAPWLSISAAAGTTPGMATVSLNQTAATLAEGVYTASAVVTAPGAVGSPITVPVSLRVVIAGTIVVKTNLDSASFSITGPTSYSGSGTSWRTDLAKPGTYTVQFGFVQGYRKPAIRTFEVTTGHSVTIDAEYRPLDVTNIIVAAKGEGLNNDSLVRVLDYNGELINEFLSFRPELREIREKYGTKVVVADIDGDGTSEILAAPGSARGNNAAIKVFRADGSLLSSVHLDGTQYGSNIAVGDILGDGNYEVAMSIAALDGSKTIVLYQFSGYKLVHKMRFALGNPSSASASPRPANIALGDIDGDGILELIVSVQGRISIYNFNETFTPTPLYSGTVALPDGSAYGRPMTVSAGDVDGDGIDEIVLGYDDGVDSFVGFYDQNLKALGPPVKVFAAGRSAPTLSATGRSADGTAEFLAGKGALNTNDSALRIYDFNGSLLKEIMPFDSLTRFGVNAAFGKKK